MIIFEGETEERSLPVFARAYWNCEPDSLGISLVSASGSGNILPFVQFAQGINIPWVELSDGDPAGQVTVSSICGKIPEGKTDGTQPNLFVLPGQANFEEYLCPGYEAEIANAVDEIEEIPGYIENEYIRKRHGQKKKGKKEPPELRDYKSEGGFQQAVLDYLLENKVKVAQPVAEAIVGLPKPRNIPDVLLQLFKRVDELLNRAPKAKEAEHAVQTD